MKISMKRIGGSCAVGLWLVMAGAGAAASNSEVADAVMRGDLAAVRTLVGQKADVNAVQADGATALHWAVYREDMVTADLLIRAGANVKAANREGVTPLSLACENGNAALVEALLKAGADVNERLPNGETPLMMASRTGSVAAMRVLLDHGVDVNSREPVRGTTALMWAAAQGNSAAVQLLIERRADVAVRTNPAERLTDTGRISPSAYAPAEGKVIGGKVLPPGPRRGGDNGKSRDLSGGGLTALVYATRRNDLESVRMLLNAGADVNQVTNYGWSPLLVATQNRYYQLGSFLLDKGADPSLANNGGWTPLYIAVDNRNIEEGDYPVRKGDMDHLAFIEKLLALGADVNAQIKDDTETRQVFTSPWLAEEGATAFLRAAQSSDLVVLRRLLAHGADPKIATTIGVTALQVAAGIGWVAGVTYEWSEQANVDTVKLLLDLGLDPNAVADTGRTALHGAGHKGRTAVIQLLVDHGAKLDVRDYGVTGSSRGGRLALHTWQPVDYADGLIRVGTQSAIGYPDAGRLLRKLMTERGLPVPPIGRTLESVCLSPELCDDVKE